MPGLNTELNVANNMPIITSLQNPRVKDAVRLRDGRHREKQVKILIDGARELRRAIAAGVKLIEAFVCEPLCAGEDAQRLLAALPQCGCEIWSVGASVFECGGAPAIVAEGVFAAESAGNITRFVLLSDGERKLPILIGPFEAIAISLPLEGTRPDRPMSHDLVHNIVERLGATLDRVVIDDLWNSIYYAKLYLKKGKEEIEMDARPADAIALAVRFDARVYVAEGILDTSVEE